MILDDFEVPWGFQNEAKNLSHPSPTPPRRRRCVGSRLFWVPRVDFGSFFDASGRLNVKKDSEMEPFLGEAVRASQGSFGSQNVLGVSLVVLVRRDFGAMRLQGQEVSSMML